MIIDGIEGFDQNKIANGFNNFLLLSLSELAPTTAHTTKDFQKFATAAEKAFKSLKPNRSPGFYDIWFLIITIVSENIFCPIKHTFYLSFQQGLILNRLKIARITPTLKKYEEYSSITYMSNLVLPCFSKLLERTIYNMFYDYLLENKLIYEK